MQNIQQFAKKGLTALIGVAMLGALGLAVVPTANAASTCEADNWSSLEGCLNQSNAGSVDTINVINDIADTGFGHPSGQYSNLNVTNTVTIMGNGHTVSYAHFHVTGGTFTLDNLKVNDGIENWPTYASEIPVSITGATLNLTNGSGLYTNGGVGRAIGILVGDNSTLNLQSAGADWGSNYGGTQAIRAASGAIVTNNSKIGETSFDDSVAATVERVSNVKINITDGVYVNENSGTDNDTYAVNTWGADVTVGGSARVQEVYVKDGTYTQTAGEITPDIDSSSVKSGNASLTLDGSAKAYIEGGTLRTADLNSGARKSIHLFPLTRRPTCVRRIRPPRSSSATGRCTASRPPSSRPRLMRSRMRSPPSTATPISAPSPKIRTSPSCASSAATSRPPSPSPVKSPTTRTPRT